MAYQSDGTFHSHSLFHVTYETARLLGATLQGKATGGSTTTVVDDGTTSSIDLTQFPDDHFNQGTIWILEDSAAAAAEPEERFARVTDFTSSTGTVTFNALSNATASSDIYAIATSKYPLHKIKDSINGALADMGPLPYSDITTLDTTASQTEYTLPVTANMDLRQVYYRGRLGDSNDKRWIKIWSWDDSHTAAITTTNDNFLILPFQYVVGRDIRIDYMQTHPPLIDERDHLHSRVHLDLVIYEAAIRLLEWRDFEAGNDPSINRQLRRWTGDRGADGLTAIERVRSEHRIYQPPRQSKLMILGRRVPVDKFTVPGP